MVATTASGIAGSINSDDPDYSLPSTPPDHLQGSDPGNPTTDTDTNCYPEPDEEGNYGPDPCPPSTGGGDGGGGGGDTGTPGGTRIMFFSRLVPLGSIHGASAESQTIAVDDFNNYKEIYYIHTRGQSFSNGAPRYDVTAGGNNYAYAVTQRTMTRPSGASGAVQWRQNGTHTWRVTPSSSQYRDYSVANMSY